MKDIINALDENEPEDGECLVCGKQICVHDEYLRYYRTTPMQNNMQNEPQLPAEMEALREELTNMVDEYFPKKNKMGGNPGRGEAMVIVGVALAKSSKALATALEEERKRCISIVENFIDHILENNTGSLEELLNQLKGEMK